MIKGGVDAIERGHEALQHAELGLSARTIKRHRGRLRDDEALNQSDLAQALQALAQQQTALLQAHADGMRLQRVLLEQMLEVGKESKPLSSAVPEATTTVQTPDVVASLRPTAHSASTPLVPAPLLTPSVVIEKHPLQPIVAAPVPGPASPHPVDGETVSALVREGPEVASPAPTVADAPFRKNWPWRPPAV